MPNNDFRRLESYHGFTIWDAGLTDSGRRRVAFGSRTCRTSPFGVRLDFCDGDNTAAALARAREIIDGHIGAWHDEAGECTQAKALNAKAEAARAIRGAKRRRDDARAALADAEAELRAATLDGVDAGLQTTEAAKIAGVTRATVYNWRKG